MISRSIKVIYGTILIIMLLVTGSSAQELVSCGQAGKTYDLYIAIRTVDVINARVTFDDKGGLIFEENPPQLSDPTTFFGNGFYVCLTSLFVGTYLTLDQEIGKTNGDYIFLLSGSTIDPYIFGVGLAILQYEYIYPMAFFGIRVIDEET